LVISKNFSVSCSNFYGIDGKYFDGTEMFENKLIWEHPKVCVNLQTDVR